MATSPDSETVTALRAAGDDRAEDDRGRGRAASAAVTDAVTAARDRFLAAQAAPLYEELTNGRTTYLRIEDLCEQAAQLVPGLLPGTADLELERSRPLAAKAGLELSLRMRPDWARAHGGINRADVRAEPITRGNRMRGTGV